MINKAQNLFEVRKTIRFELLPKKGNIKELKISNNHENSNIINEFISSYKLFLSTLKNILFKNGDLSSKVKIKFSFLKTYLKQQYYDNKLNELKGKNKNQILLNSKELSFLKDELINKFQNNFYLIEQIEQILELPEKNQAQKSELNFLFNKIFIRDNFEFFENLIKNINSENSYVYNNIQENIKKINTLNNQIESIKNILRPAGSYGIEVERLSLNYYTVNKKPKNYDELIENKKKDFNKLIGDFKEKNGKNIFDNNIASNSGFNDYLLNLDENIFGELKVKTGKDTYEYKKEKKYFYLPIKKAYELMKEYKAEQKQAFIQFLAQEKTYEDLKNDFEFHITKEKTKNIRLKLFDDIKENDFNEVIKLTKQIKQLGEIKNKLTNYNNNLKEEIELLIYNYNQEYTLPFEENIEENLEKLKETIGEEMGKIARKRGNYFQTKFKKYINFSEEYKKVAIQFGQIKAQIKSLEKEKIDAKKIDSWALILQKDNQHYILSIPRKSGKLFNAKREIDGLRNIENGEYILYKFESLTLQALDKLCFGKENNTFRGGIYNEAKNYDNLINNKGRLKQKFEIKDEKELIKFYQTVLKLGSARKQIKLSYFNKFELEKFLNKNFENIDDFASELKKICYVKFPIKIDEEKLNEIISNYNGKLFKITSYDLQKNDKEFIEKLEIKDHFDRLNPEIHTKIWLDFWTKENQENKYPIRLNPELKINFVPKKEKEKNNRFSKDRFILTTTISLNALGKNTDLAFKNTEELENFYKEFNKNIVKELKNPYFYGLDRGDNELISLGLFDKNLKPVKIKVYNLKKEKYLEQNEKGYIAYKNISYFSQEKYEDFYEEKEVTCINLSYAKLIKGKIYLNGDIASYLKLKLLAGKRKIYELVSKKENKSCEIIEKKNKFYIKGNNEIIYIYDDNFDNIISKEEIKEELQNYLDTIKNNLSNNGISIEKINNLRTAIIANMVGIITFLFEKYPGFIVFEDKNIEDNKKRFEKYNITLGTLIEQKIFQKFSTIGTIPPSYKKYLTLKDKGFKQLGNILYIDEKNTSSACPVCNEKLTGNSNIHNLFGHGYGPDFESKMKHLTDEEYEELKNNNILKPDDLKKNKYKPGTINGKSCDFYFQNPKYKDFNFIKTGDDLATYNIAKKGLEYSNSLNN